MEILAGLATELKLTIGLENPEDGQGYILNNATDGTRILRKLDSGWVKLNYDFSNILTLTKGKNIYDTGLKDALPYIAHLHLKNVKQQKDSWLVCGLEEGIINYKKLFREYPALLNVPASIELPLRFGYNKAFEFVPQNRERPPLEKIRKILHDSIIWLDSHNPVLH